jgi:phage shock protein PspC (stress-responsive transcriptional regulator)
MRRARPYIPLLFRNRAAGWVTGVCAGLSELTGIKVWLLRCSFVTAVYFYPITIISIYALLTLFLRDKSEWEHEEVVDSVFEEESERLAAVHREYLQIQERIAEMESDAISKEAELRRRFRDAGLA